MVGNKSTKQSWWQMTSIQVGGAICLPIIMVGQELARNYGFAKAALSILIGNFLLFLIGVVKVKMAYENKQTTIRNAEKYFGNKGTKFFACNIIISLLGWFAIQLNLISLSVEKCFKTILGYSPLSIVAMSICLGVAITLAALKGMKALKTLSYISMPILIFTLFYTIYKAFMYGGTTVSTPVITTSSLGISLVLAAMLSVIIDIPTYYRFSKSLKDSVISVFATMVLATSVIEIAGTYIAVQLPGATILETLTAYNSSFYQIIILLFLVLAGWSTNNANLYSSAVTLEKIFPKFSQKVRTLIIGAAGTFLAFFNILSKFETTLSLMGILTSSMGAVIIVRYLSKSFVSNLPKSCLFNIIAWGCGVLQGLLAFFKIFSITSIEIIDVFLVSSLVSFVFTFFQYKVCRNEK